MSSSSRPSRRDRAFSSLGRLLGRRGGARGLADRAGRSIGRSMVEPLEERRLLFTITIDPGEVDPFTGLGTEAVDFTYFLTPLIAAEPEEAEAPEPVIEDFNGEDGTRTVFSGRRFDSSNIAYRGESSPGTSIQLIPGNTDVDTQQLQLRLDELGEFAEFLLPAIDDEDGPLFPARPLSAAEFSLGGFDANSISLEIYLSGQLLTTISGAAAWDAIRIDGSIANGTFRLTELDAGSRFDAIRFVADPGQLSAFTLDDLIFTPADLSGSALLVETVFGARATFTGPVGSSVSLFDLFGNSIIPFTYLGEAQDADGLVYGDIDGDGNPDANIGIGRIEFSGTNDRSI